MIVHPYIIQKTNMKPLYIMAVLYLLEELIMYENTTIIKTKNCRKPDCKWYFDGDICFFSYILIDNETDECMFRRE